MPCCMWATNLSESRFVGLSSQTDERRLPSAFPMAPAMKNLICVAQALSGWPESTLFRRAGDHKLEVQILTHTLVKMCFEPFPNARFDLPNAFFAHTKIVTQLSEANGCLGDQSGVPNGPLTVIFQGLSEGNDAAVAARNAECYDDCADTFVGHQESYESAFQDTRIGTAVSSVGAALLGTGISLLVIF